MKHETIAKKVRKLRDTRSITVREVSRLLGMRYSSVNAILVFPKKPISDADWQNAERGLRSVDRDFHSQMLRLISRMSAMGASEAQIVDFLQRFIGLVHVVGQMTGVKGSQS